MTAVIDAAQVTLSAGQATILDGVTFQLEPRELCVVTGGDALQKSSLMEVLVGLTRPTGGQLKVCGFDPRCAGLEVRRRSTYVERPDVFETHLTTRNNVRHFLRLSGRSVPTNTDLERALRDSEVPDRDFDRPTSALSAGVLFSVWIALVRLRESALALFQDPTDYVSSPEVAPLARQLRELAATGPGLLVTTSDGQFAEALGGTVYSLYRGRVTSAPAFRWPSSMRPW